MRTVFIGASNLAIMTARLLLKRRHEVVLIERNKERLETLAQELDCGFLHGDGSKPAILKEADPQRTDILFCLTGNDQANILASLVGRSLGFARLVTKIEDPELEHICLELGLEDTIIPARTIGRYLADMAEGQDPLEISTMIRDEARIFSFVARDEDSGPVGELDLPSPSRVAAIYRTGKFVIPEDDTELKPQDEVVVIVHRKDVGKLEERWSQHRPDR